MVTFRAKLVHVPKFGFVINNWLFADPLKTPLNWRVRLQIAIGVTAALVSCEVILLSVYCHDRLRTPFSCMLT